MDIFCLMCTYDVSVTTNDRRLGIIRYAVVKVLIFFFDYLEVPTFVRRSSFYKIMLTGVSGQ